MQDLNGMDTARKIREFDNNVEIIFTTSVLDYIYEGYEVNAFESVGNNSDSGKKKVLYRRIGVTLFILSIILDIIGFVAMAK